MNGTWLVISNAEKRLAKDIVQEFFAGCADMESSLKAFMDNRSAIIKRIGNFSGSFAKEQTDISTNVFAQIAYSVSEQMGFNGANGVVLTSNILAEDMVRMSLMEWLYINSQYSRDDIFKFVYGTERWMLSDIALIHKVVNLRWYDPCVGGGVYPLSIIEVLKSLGISIRPLIFGIDVNPLYVEATKIRVAISMQGDFERNYNFVDSYFVVGDALDTFLPQNNIFNYEKEAVEYDIVVGNPPYINAGKINQEAKKKYSNNYPEIKTKKADMYIYFIAHGLNTLSSKGVLTFVSPAQFQSSSYGKSIRVKIEKNSGLLAIADFNELPVFKNIGAHISVYCLAKNYKPTSFLRYEYDELDVKHPLRRLYQNGVSIAQKNVGADGWNFSSGDVYDILTFISEHGEKLRDYSKGVYSGIKSGCKKAFWLKESELSEFSEYDLAHVRKMYIPKNIRRWHGEWNGEFLAIIKKDESLEEDSKLFKHMLSYKKDLESRSDIQKHSTWYGLRECNYYDYLFAPKILYPDIATECRFMMDKEGISIPDGAFFLPEENYYLLGILNSCVGRYYFKEKCARIGNPQKGGRIRFKKVYVEEFPVVSEKSNTNLSSEISEIAKKGTEKGMLDSSDERRLDELALQLYQIPHKYWKIMQEA